ncbi:bifunctional tRNA (5-methylaminomethyl-2-thiouridine)(34)-methyltransferase MnmD/FAD-dependent 5-carboxymethylaminomethyl-2-thiouridine(34) oxidoreductase MnmC [Idiomarina sp. OT37-5b]|uniref:bifunctional tRNA (5-methylaminomethyl-2-thiouridine)(34)-methyltransferase MnmD/FAD-dependent 5-carboxymethylaminomethyl-2-thiouridine(34) oxidoreductase MnmC n=1 Tax=Idiomarina sp. OT37-5b TaxID=2100422 RepID=UPI000CF864FD|nr:bifunctional tRNA (5-methylaminomethyl-2-thiouridine)(34)-methyltransferase MnmD/FAD-dependent 5-carboxymethylaminomethyl-2-thiouridine(34) oxidoreductase MnmC [Idiomarina sp. OT37-5b]AVJ55484.1 bifunctional tRNA (5-methylaminomethyl-2-thiouridine)(34)-methyltransferase MnmD/FAD-dependent 5-carboxymethylaminomethyl-2-thiouridine(34) oxidoreductase MnmC [Idiomarina sp. OT37-5b]
MNSTADIHFNSDGVPVSNQFDDIYFSVDSGIDESRYVFLQHNGLPEAFAKLPQHYEYVVTETGFGTGLNFLLCWQAFVQHAPASCRLVFVSFEKFPLSRAQLQQAYQALPQLQPLCDQLLAVYPSPEQGCHRLCLADGRVTLDLWCGDIEDQLPQFIEQARGQVDRWFLDGFAPAKNPQMWQPFLFEAMAASAHQHTRYATFTAAGVVKRGLQAAGFSVEKVKGFGRKREMLCGQAQQSQLPCKQALRTDAVTVVGGGIAAATLTLALTRRGVPVKVVSNGIADGASGNPQGAVYPLLHAETTPLSQFYLQAFSTAVSYYLPWRHQHWFDSGVMQPGFNPQRRQRAEKIASGLYSEQTVSLQTPAQADAAANLAIGQPSLLYPAAGWLRPAPLVKALFDGAAAELKQTQFEPADVQPHTPTVIACGHHSAALVEAITGERPSLNPVRGQISLVRATPATTALRTVLCYKGYMVPADNGLHCIGATFNRGDDGTDVRSEDDQQNQASLADCAEQPWAAGLEHVASRVSVRATTPDHQPMAGLVANKVYVCSGLGSRGLTAAPVLAEVLAAQITGGLQPLSSDALARLTPR